MEDGRKGLVGERRRVPAKGDDVFFSLEVQVDVVGIGRDDDLGCP